eukprot:16440076-Heterocapsa_arctica.AAC.1
MKAEHEEQVTRAGKIEAEATANSQNTASANERTLALKRQEHHTILQAEKARHSAVLRKQEEDAAHNAAIAQQAAALELQRSEQMSAEIEKNWQTSSKQWYSEQAATQSQTVWEAKANLDEQAREFQDMVNHRESVIAGLHDEMKSRDALNCALALSKASEIEL